MSTTIDTADTSATIPTTGGRARWARLASLAFVLAGAGPLAMLGAGLLWGLDVGDEVGYFLVTAAIAFIAAALVRARGTWRKVVGIIAGVLAGFGLFWTVFGLFVPASFFDFVPGVIVLPGVLVGVGGGIAAIRAQRRGDVSTDLAKGERMAMRIVLAVVAAAVVISGSLTLATRDTISDDVAVDLTIQMSDFEFDLERYVVEPGARILVRNDDPFMHTFTVDALDIDVAVNPGSEKLVVVPDTPGSYTLYCEPHTEDSDDPSDDDMAAVLEVS